MQQLCPAPGQGWIDGKEEEEREEEEEEEAEREERAATG